ncbi:MAG: acriflavine resistance protein B [Bacteroidia bacterium]|nr:MAG: acriflavine resistance protein B [Bacteroidia bacterium]
MLNRIISFSLYNQWMIAVLVLGLITLGVSELKHLPIDAVPDITDNQVQVITISPSLGATDMERFITYPIEQNCMNIPGLKKMRSFSRLGLSIVTLVFEEKIDIYWARQQVTERLKAAEEMIPKGMATPFLAPVTTGLGEIYQYILKPQKGYEQIYSLTDLRTIQDWIVRKHLLSVKGVADVSSFGGKLKQYEVQIDPSVLNAHHITIQEIYQALNANNTNSGGSYIEKENNALFIRTEGLFSNIQDIENTVIKNYPNGNPLLIKDIAKVKEGHAIRFGAMTYNDYGEVAGAVVMMLKGENSSQVIQNVKKQIQEIQKILPQGIEIVPYLDRTKMVNNAISTVSTNLMEGALIVVFVLVLFLGNMRAGLIVASVIPLSMLLAIFLMNVFGVSGNLMSLGALDFGLIVDGAVIIVESVLHAFHQPRSSLISKNETVKKAATQMLNSAVFGQMIILMVYVPIFTLEGIEGKMFKPMAQTVIFALLGAFLLSMTYVPMMCALFLKPSEHSQPTFSDKMMAFFCRYHQKGLHQVLQYPKTIFLIVSILFLGTLYQFTRLGGEFIPELPEGDFAVETRVLAGSNLSTTIEAVQKSSKILLDRFPEIQKIVGKIGSSEIPIDPMPLDAADMIINLKDKSEWKSAKTWEELAQKMQDTLNTYIPGVTFGFQYPVAMRFNELMTGVKQDVACKIYGENLDTLAFYAEKIAQNIKNIEGITDIFVEKVQGLPQIIIQIKREQLTKYGLTVQTLNDYIQACYAGLYAGIIYEEEKRFDLVIKIQENLRNQISELQNLLIPLPNGNFIPLHVVAEVTIKNNVNQVQREDGKRRIYIGFNIQNRDVESVVQEVQQILKKKVKLPTGYWESFGGAYENLETAKARLSIAVPIALIVIGILLYLAFQSLKLTFMIYSVIPLSAIGGILSLSLRDMPFSISAGVGFIALFGIAVLNGIVLISEFRRIQKENPDWNLEEIVKQGSQNRLRPVLMTAMVASLGFLPMALSTGNGAEVQRPLATVVIGGLLVATFLTLFLLPLIYKTFYHFSLPKTPLKTFLLITSFIFPYSITNAQMPITWQQALDTALKNHKTLQSYALKKDYYQTLQKTYFNIPTTQMNLDIGQFNSIYWDNKISINQSLAFPTYYAHQKNYLQKVYQNSVYQYDLQEIELKRDVLKTYWNYIILQAKQKLYQDLDSIYQAFDSIYQIRWEKGDINKSEKQLLEVQKSRFEIQLQQNQLEILNLELLLEWLLQSPQKWIPQSNSLIFDYPILLDTNVIKKHPYNKIFENQTEIQKSFTKVEQSKRLPEWNLGYNNTTIMGMGADDIYYPIHKRFQYFQIGIGIPIFQQAPKNYVKAAKIQEQIAQTDLQNVQYQLKNEYLKAWNNYSTSLKNLQKFQQEILPKSKQLLEITQKRFQNGDIAVTEMFLSLQQYVETQISYLETIQKYNEAVIQCYYYQNQ